MTHRTLLRSKGAHRPTFFQFSDSAVAPRWCIAMIWSWGGLSRSRRGKSRTETRGGLSRGRGPCVLARFLLSLPRKGRPRPKGPGSIAGWVRGWGLGGTPPGAVGSTLRRRPGFLCPKLFSRPCAARGLAAVRARPMGDVGWQLDLPPVGKLEISQMDAEGSLGSAMALDHVACADREPARELICEQTHDNPPGH